MYPSRAQLVHQQYNAAESASSGVVMSMKRSVDAIRLRSNS
jgi:hypothetical protein